MSNKMTKEAKHKKLLATHNNNIIISDMNLKEKYTNFEISKLKEISDAIIKEFTV